MSLLGAGLVIMVHLAKYHVGLLMESYLLCSDALRGRLIDARGLGQALQMVNHRVHLLLRARLEVELEGRLLLYQWHSFSTILRVEHLRRDER